MGISRQQRDPDLLVTHRGNVNLAACAPVYFHEIAPRRNMVVPPESKARGFAGDRVQSGGPAHTRILSIGAHNAPAGRKLGSITCTRAPKQPDPELRCAAGQKLVQARPPQRQPGTGLKLDRHGDSLVEKKAAPNAEAGGA